MLFPLPGITPRIIHFYMSNSCLYFNSLELSPIPPTQHTLGPLSSPPETIFVLLLHIYYLLCTPFTILSCKCLYTKNNIFLIFLIIEIYLACAWAFQFFNKYLLNLIALCCFKYFPCQWNVFPNIFLVFIWVICAKPKFYYE